LALAALAHVVFGAYDSYPPLTSQQQLLTPRGKVIGVRSVSSQTHVAHRNRKWQRRARRATNNNEWERGSFSFCVTLYRGFVFFFPKSWI